MDGEFGEIRRMVIYEAVLLALLADELIDERQYALCIERLTGAES